MPHAIKLDIWKFECESGRGQVTLYRAVQLIARVIMQVSADKGGIAELREILLGERAHGFLPPRCSVAAATAIIGVARAMVIWPDLR